MWLDFSAVWAPVWNLVWLSPRTGLLIFHFQNDGGKLAILVLVRHFGTLFEIHALDSKPYLRFKHINAYIFILSVTSTQQCRSVQCTIICELILYWLPSAPVILWRPTIKQHNRKPLPPYSSICPWFPPEFQCTFSPWAHRFPAITRKHGVRLIWLIGVECVHGALWWTGLVSHPGCIPASYPLFLG